MNSMINIDLSQISSIVFLAAMALTGVVLVFFGYKLLNAIPAKWLCDYNEEPTEDMYKMRYSYKKSGIIISALFAVIMVLCGMAFGLSVYTLLAAIIMYLLLLIAVCDMKYAIIPDQFVVALAVFAAGFALFDYFNSQFFITSWWSPLLGALCGGGVLVLVNLISLLVFRKMGMGMGDAKLMAAVGLCFGFPNIFAPLVMGVIFAFLYVVYLLLSQFFTKKEKSHYFPFGPFLCIGCLCEMLCLALINGAVNWYIQLLTL